MSASNLGIFHHPHCQRCRPTYPCSNNEWDHDEIDEVVTPTEREHIVVIRAFVFC